ncbi:C40 family peptidase [Dysgonomonas sp. Marseille-P4677]|uniref:C40 family peptidase n=1 Tax=Dysgonomonas sp. Marseille-P4677 TaxID=2364790 RepID=UPI00191300C7|nr:C40 family peptidase [Dysgonomonas sp. Marseille-P4677]MBK5719803.1 C40 family peptidase [Dysgonomonas sp. Marseille-P4677]
MSVSKRILIVSTLFLIFSTGFMPTTAATLKQSKGTPKKSKTSAVTTKKVKVEQSTKNIKVETSDGNVVALPKVNQVLEENSSLFPSSMEFIADANISNTLDALQKKMIEQKEIQELSSVLGINIQDATYLDFYREAADWLGTRYRRGGMSRAAVDCSGFTNIIYKNVFGIQLDRVSTTIAKNVKESVAKEDLKPGDMVFFSTFKKKYINHVGVYLGDGKFIHASIKYGVIVSSLAEGYYSKTWRKGGRI